MKKILLFSGGLDSYIAWHYLDKPKTVYFDTGVGYSEMEIKTIARLVPDTLIDSSLRLYERQVGLSSTAFIPMRNLYLAMLACHYGDEIVIAGLCDDNVNDKNAAIFIEFSRVLSELNCREIKVTSPFWDMTKADIVKWYLDQGLPTDNLLQTGSCYTPELVSTTTFGDCYCGRCTCCFRKWVALWVNGIETSFFDRYILEDYYQRAQKGMYLPQRNRNIIAAYHQYSAKLKEVSPQGLAVEASKDIAIDIDGILTNETQGHDYQNRTPNLENIKKVNELFNKGNHITLWTSRYPQDREITEAWLVNNGVSYNDLVLGKLQYDQLIDDKALNTF